MAWLCQLLAALPAKMESAHRARVGKMQLETNSGCLSRKSAVHNPELLTQRKKQPVGHGKPLGWGEGPPSTIYDYHLWDGGLRSYFRKPLLPTSSVKRGK